jgi:hypothetical protein
MCHGASHVELIIYRVDSKVVDVAHVETAVGAALTGELAKHAVAEGNKAVTRFKYGNPNLCFSFGMSCSLNICMSILFAPLKYHVSRTCAVACQGVAA